MGLFWRRLRRLIKLRRIIYYTTSLAAVGPPAGAAAC